MCEWKVPGQSTCLSPMLRAASAPDLFYLRGESVELSSACGALVSSLISQRATPPGVAVWRPRTHPSERLSIQLKLFNQTFLDLCDAVSFADNSVGSVFPSSPIFLSEDSANASHTSWERFLSAMDKFHLAELGHCSQVFVHISLLGRMRPVWLELYAFHDRNALTEFLMVETPLTEEVPLQEMLHISASLQPLQESASLSLAGSVALPPSSPASASPSPPPPLEVLWSCPPTQDTSRDPDWQECAEEEPPRKKSAESKSSAACRPRGGFRCTECGTRETTQKRYGLIHFARVAHFGVLD